MFGYVLTNIKTLSDEQGKRFRSIYCGMCHSLHKRYGNISRFTLSYDMTFLALILSALYECDETVTLRKCLPHPFKKHHSVSNEMVDYAADMNVLLAYHKLRDNISDDHSPAAMAEAKLLSNAYNKAAKLRPRQSEIIECWMDENARLERSKSAGIDAGMNLTGEMLGKLFLIRDDFFSEYLYAMGDNLGKFIYFMDAYEDLEKDEKKGRYNALREFSGQSDYEDLCKATLSMLAADCADAFERLPIVKDADLIRNILYSGIWAKYGYIQDKKARKKGLKENKDAGSV